MNSNPAVPRSTFRRPSRNEPRTHLGRRALVQRRLKIQRWTFVSTRTFPKPTASLSFRNRRQSRRLGKLNMANVSTITSATGPTLLSRLRSSKRPLNQTNAYCERLLSLRDPDNKWSGPPDGLPVIGSRELRLLAGISFTIL
jgi:hypothetical protein